MKQIFILLFVCVSIAAQDFKEAQAGGEYTIFSEQTICLTEESRAEIMARNIESVEKLTRLGIIKENTTKSASSYLWPIHGKEGIDDFKVYGISNYIDHNPSYPNQVLDYNNGFRTYDTQDGYNHKGTDIFSWPFPWYKMDNSEVEIRAIADGVIIGKDDGNQDRSCSFGNNNWNAVYVKNNDGSTAWYGHMKKNSLTSKAVGASVSAGEFLGIVGSSGISTGPHLHLEIYDAGNNLIDPWLGPTNPTTNVSWWASQKSYYEPKVNKIATHSTWPEIPDCPTQEIPHFKSTFKPGEPVYFVIYYSDQLRNVQSTYQVYTPENTLFNQWTHSLTQADHYAASWWGWSNSLPQSASIGTWRFVVTFNGEFYTHYFTVSNTTDVTELEGIPTEFNLSQNYPNPFNPVTKIRFAIPSNTQENISLKVFDVLGNQIADLLNESKNAGIYEVEFDASNIPSGIYFYRLAASNFVKTNKMILIK